MSRGDRGNGKDKRKNKKKEEARRKNQSQRKAAMKGAAARSKPHADKHQKRPSFTLPDVQPEQQQPGSVNDVAAFDIDDVNDLDDEDGTPAD